MWEITAFAKGRWSAIKVPELAPGVPFSSRQALELSGKLLSERYKHLMQYLQAEATTEVASGDPTPARDAIELWAPMAQQQSLEHARSGVGKVQAIEDALGYFPELDPFETNPDALATLAWNDRTGVIIPLDYETEEIIVRYIPEEDEERRLQGYRSRYPSADCKLETIFDWRGYLGAQSVVTDGWNAMQRRGRAFVTSIRARFGFIVGKILRRNLRPQSRLDRDPLYEHRLKSMIKSHPDVAKAVPDLVGMNVPVTHDTVVVFVHGTASCGLQSLKDLHPDHLRVPTYRFEHDTFRPLERNAGELAYLISTYVHAKNLILVGHSRGGLVARVALAQLRRDKYPAPITLHTFGTPHRGTPLVYGAAKILNQIFKLGGHFLGALPSLTPLSWAYNHLLDAPELPPGIDVMRPDGDGLALLNALGDPQGVDCWGSRFNPDYGPSGFSVEVENILASTLNGMSHDLIVPTSSALYFGASRPELQCSHINYFQQKEVQDFFDSLGPPISAPNWLEKVTLQQDMKASRRIELMKNVIDLGGVKVSRRPDTP